MANGRPPSNDRLTARRPPLPLRAIVHATFGALWCLGAVIFVLEHFFTRADEFGAAVHPWQPSLTELHGIVAVFATYLFGWMCADHVARAWRSATVRSSGLWMLALVAVLAVTGFAAFFLVADSARAVNGVVHEYLGLALIVPWVAHAAARFRRRRGASKKGARGGRPQSVEPSFD